MKNVMLAIACLALLVTGAQAQDTPSLKNQKEKASYSLGYKIGQDFKQQGIEIAPDVLLQGMKDALAGGKTALTEDQMREALMGLQKEVMAKQQEQYEKLAEKNLEESKKFLLENRKKKGVKTTTTGLQYKVVEKGTGKKPGPEDTVTVHYRGRLIDGTEFDSSFKRNEPATFPVKGVIAGWTEALQMMKEGAKWQLFIPADLAYGEKGVPGIGPNSVLIFDVELLKVGKK
jgi:FKBP-type peptidyl-prolyl cis-trans isomerase FklB